MRRKHITVGEHGAVTIKYDDPDEHTAFLAALDLIEAGERLQRAVVNGGQRAAEERTQLRKLRDDLIRGAADKDTGDPRTLAARLAKRRWPTLSGQRDADGKPLTEKLTARTIRNALHRTAPKEKRKLA